MGMREQLAHGFGERGVEVRERVGLGEQREDARRAQRIRAHRTPLVERAQRGECRRDHLRAGSGQLSTSASIYSYSYSYGMGTSPCPTHVQPSLYPM